MMFIKQGEPGKILKVYKEGELKQDEEEEKRALKDREIKTSGENKCLSN